MLFVSYECKSYLMRHNLAIIMEPVIKHDLFDTLAIFNANYNLHNSINKIQTM